MLLTASFLLLISYFLFRTVSAMRKVPLTYIYNRVKVEFVGEDGIDSGGLGKEAFLLLARDAAKYAGPGYKNWLVVHKTAIMAPTAAAAVDNSSASSGSSLYSTSSNGGLFFTDDDKEKDKKIGGGGGGGSGGMKGKTSDQKRQLRNNNNNNNNNSNNDNDHNNNPNDNHDPIMSVHSVEASLSILEEDDRMDRQAFFLFLGRFVAKALYDRQVYDPPSLTYHQPLTTPNTPPPIRPTITTHPPTHPSIYSSQLIDLPLAPILFKHMVGDVAHDEQTNPSPVPTPTHSLYPSLVASPVGSPSPGPGVGSMNGQRRSLTSLPSPSSPSPTSPSFTTPNGRGLDRGSLGGNGVGGGSGGRAVSPVTNSPIRPLPGLSAPGTRPLTPVKQGPSAPGTRPLTPVKQGPSAPGTRPLTPVKQGPSAPGTRPLTPVKQPLHSTNNHHINNHSHSEKTPSSSPGGNMIPSPQGGSAGGGRAPPPQRRLTPTHPPHLTGGVITSLSEKNPSAQGTGARSMPPSINTPPTTEVPPPPTILTDDDLADFPDELCEHARRHVKKRLLQALVDVRTLDAQLYKSLVWMLNNDITNVIDEMFTVVSTSTGPTPSFSPLSHIVICCDIPSNLSLYTLRYNTSLTHNNHPTSITKYHIDVMIGGTVPLCRDGENKTVTEENKFEYVELMARWKVLLPILSPTRSFNLNHPLTPSHLLLLNSSSYSPSPTIVYFCVSELCFSCDDRPLMLSPLR